MSTCWITQPCVRRTGSDRRLSPRFGSGDERRNGSGILCAGRIVSLQPGARAEWLVDAGGARRACSFVGRKWIREVDAAAVAGWLVFSRKRRDRVLRRKRDGEAFRRGDVLLQIPAARRAGVSKSGYPALQSQRLR